MKFTPTNITTGYLVEVEPIVDVRGFFARSFCAEEFQQHGLESNFQQCNVSFTAKQGTIRGMHDPTFGIEMPLPVSLINVRDRDYPDFVI
jgi:dTDP-4-dehydrorhamnose 3,5-epimerase-like enzyme